jgi:hypothetical protein
MRDLVSRLQMEKNLCGITDEFRPSESVILRDFGGFEFRIELNHTAHVV